MTNVVRSVRNRRLIGVIVATLDDGLIEVDFGGSGPHRFFNANDLQYQDDNGEWIE